MKRLLIAMVALLGVVSCTKESFVLWQLPSQVDTISNSYVIRTVNGKVIVMDGGFADEKDYLRGFIDALGGKVDAWIISHPHDDHINAFIALMENPKGLKVDKIYHSRFPEELILASDEQTIALTRKFYSLLDNAIDIEIIDCHSGDEFEIDGVNFKVLAEKNPDILKPNAYNNSSMVLKMWDSKKSFIFLGDLGVEGGQKLLKSEYVKDLECDYLQIAHHGNAGCDKEFYQTVKFRACLWPTPSWIYNPKMDWLTTMEVRGWMEELGITEHYISYQGLARIE